MPLRPAVALLLLLGTAGAVSGTQAGVSVPRYTHPGAGQVFYFLLTDRFSNGSTGNDTGGIEGGPDKSGFDPTRISHYHGGDLAGLTSKLDYIRGLGTTAIWITPPFKNKPMQEGTAGYHGYWILDFTSIDPHLGTEEDFRRFVAGAHQRGMRVYLDIVVNHTADVIKYADGRTNYIPMAEFPYRDASGAAFNPHDVAFNGIGPASFPVLSAEASFPHRPVVDPPEADAKRPGWLNDVTNYHNRGNSHFEGENSLFGDFAGLDDLFTEKPVVVRGFIDVYSRWMRRFGVDGFRIDTVKHVNLEFWEAFAPAIRQEALSLGRPDFLEFGEVANHEKDMGLMSEFTTTGNLDGVLDFRFYDGARDFVSKGGDAADLDGVFYDDGWYTGPSKNSQALATFVSNHDDGRLGTFLKKDNPGASRDRLAELTLLGYDLLLTVRGQPVVYYGDEQGMTGIGNDMGAREDMFPSRSPQFMDQELLGTSRRGTDDKFDEGHPFYVAIGRLAAIRNSNRALSSGAMIVRPNPNRHVFAFSRIDRDERVEFLVASNNSRTDDSTADLQTSQAAGARLKPIFVSNGAEAPELSAGPGGRVTVSLRPLEFVIWRAKAPLSAGTPISVHLRSPSPSEALTFTQRQTAGHTIPVRREVRADLEGGDGFAEVTFTLRRSSRPDQSELLGTADSPPYRVFWRPAADMAPGERLEFVATASDLRGHASVSAADGVTFAGPGISFGIKGAKTPLLTAEPPAAVALSPGRPIALRAAATGTEPLEYAWLHDGAPVKDGASATLTLDGSGRCLGSYLLLVRNREGTAVSREVVVSAAH
jgi:alpha-amylase